MVDLSRLDAVRADYDRVAAVYAERFRTVLADQPVDRAVHTAFADLVRAGGGGPVADLGCGPGHHTAHLHNLGLDAFGIDLSPRMVALARAAYPGLRFDVGTITTLDLPDGALAGALAWFSLIHLAPGEVPAVVAEIHRVLAPGGLLLVAAQAADDDADAPQPFDHKVSPAHRWAPGHLAALLGEAGFVEVARMVRQPEPSERFAQASVLARRPRQLG